MISARDVLFNKDKFYDGKLICFIDTPISELDEAIAKVIIVLNRDLDDIQLREDSNIEDAEDIQEINDIDEAEKNPEVKKEPEPIKDNSDSTPYPTLEPIIKSSYLT